MTSSELGLDIKKMAKPDPTAEVDKLLFDPTSSLDFNNLGKAVTDTFNLAKYEKMSYTDTRMC